MRPFPAVTPGMRAVFGSTATESIAMYHGRNGPGGVPVIVCHGALALADTWYGAASAIVPRELAYRGVTCGAPDLAGISTWGNDAFKSAIDAAISYLASNHGTRTDKVAFYGVSMGGLCLNWMLDNLSKVVAAALVVPVMALEAMHDRDPTGWGVLIDGAYTDHAGFVAALPTHDPMRNTAAFRTIKDRIRVFYSSNDTTVVPSEVLGFARAAEIEAVNVGAIGHSLNFDQGLVHGWLATMVRAAG